MPDKKISEYAAVSSVAYADIFLCNQGGTTKTASAIKLLAPLRVDTIAALRLHEKPTAPTLCIAEGGVLAGDGGGGDFFWDPNSSAADDGIAVVAPNAGGVGRWRRLHLGAAPGSLAEPGLSIAGDRDTGLAQLGGADTLSVVTGGVERAQIGGTFAIIGNATIGGTFGVTGASTLTGGASIPVGSISAPGLSVIGDANTGLAQLSGLDTFSVVTAGAERVRFDSAGNIILASTQSTILATNANQTLELRGNKSAADAGTGVLIDNGTASRTAGNLFGVRNFGSDRLLLTHAGVLQLPAAAPAIHATNANTSLTLRGNRDAGDGNWDLLFDTAALRTTGYITRWANQGNGKLFVRFDGSIALADNTVIDSLLKADSSITFRGNRSAADATEDLIFDTSATRTAGFIARFKNAGSTKASVTFDGKFIASAFTSGSSSENVVIEGRLLAADSGTDVLIRSSVDRTAGNILAVQDSGTSVVLFPVAGGLQFPSGIGQVAATGANSPIRIVGNRDAADAGADVILRATSDRTAGNIVSIEDNAGSSVKAAIRFDGSLALADNTALDSVLKANSTLTLKGNRDAGDGGTDVEVRSSATRTSGNIFAISDNGAAVLRVNHDGALELAGGTGSVTATGAAAAFVAAAANSSATIRGNRSAGDAGADVIINSSVDRTAGTILAVQDNGTNRVTVSHDGLLSTQSISVSQQSGVLVNGDNHDVATSTGSYLRLTGPNAAYAITGFAGGVSGRVLYVQFGVAQDVTIKNANAGSIAANRILTSTGADVTLTGAGGAMGTFIYSATDTCWMLLGTQG